MKPRVVQFLKYFFAFAAIIGLVFAGSINKTADSSELPIMLAISDSNYSVSVDQLSELYIVAEIANNVNLESSNYLNMDYISAQTQYSINQTTSSKIEKVNIVDTSHLSRGIIEYTVEDGESMEDIADRFGLTTDQIRWSNNLKTTDLDEGDVLYLPSTPGIIYTVKDDDEIDSIADKYDSDEEQIIAYNDLETSGLVSGARIILPGGSLPETERPEYVAPKKTTTTSTSSYSSTRLYSTSSNPMPYGWCTWYAWQWRYDHDDPLPGGLGNARYWAGQLASRGYTVDRTPSYGAVFVSQAGYYGHVGIVTNVYDDGTIEITDMNGRAGWGRVDVRDVDSSEWGSWQFVH